MSEITFKKATLTALCIQPFGNHLVKKDRDLKFCMLMLLYTSMAVLLGKFKIWDFLEPLCLSIEVETTKFRDSHLAERPI